MYINLASILFFFFFFIELVCSYYNNKVWIFQYILYYVTMENHFSNIPVFPVYMLSNKKIHFYQLLARFEKQILNSTRHFDFMFTLTSIILISNLFSLQLEKTSIHVNSYHLNHILFQYYIYVLNEKTCFWIGRKKHWP